MFRFSDDEFLAKKQQEKATSLLEEILKYSAVEHCPEIEKFFDSYVKSYEFLEELPNIFRQQNSIISMSCVPYDCEVWRAKMDLQVAYDKTNKSCKDTIPFIEFSFPKDYECKHGESYMHVFIFFSTDSKQFEESRDRVLHYLNKLNKLKVFL